MSDKNNLSANAVRKANGLFAVGNVRDVSLREELAAAKAASLAQSHEDAVAAGCRHSI